MTLGDRPSRSGRSAPEPVDDGTWTDADIKNCKDKATAAAEIAKKRKLAAVSADRVGLGGPDRRDGGARDLSSLRRDAQAAASLPELLAGLVHAGDQGARGRVSSRSRTSAYWTKVNVAERAQARGRRTARSGRPISDDLDQTTREIGKMHEEIIAAFRSLVADGIIIPDDFGVFFGMGIPPEIGAMIGDARPVATALRLTLLISARRD